MYLFGDADNNIMEYVLFAFSDSQAPIKARLSKLRHLDSLFFFLLILALLFFQVFQHRHLREELLSRRADYMLEELLQERLPQLEREIEQLRALLSDERGQIVQRLQENKQLTLELGRELGLPFRNSDGEEENGQTKEQQSVEGQGEGREGRNYEVIEIEPEQSGEDDSDVDERTDSSEDAVESDSFPEEEVITTSEHRKFCTYLQYLKEGQDYQPRPTWSRPSKQQFGINTSNYVHKSSIELDDHSLEQMRRIAEGVGKMLLISVLIAVVLLLTFQKRRRGKHARSFLRDLWRKVWPEERRRVKEWKLEREWRSEKEMLDL